MTRKQRWTFATYYLVEVIGYDRSQAEKIAYLELWQLDDLGAKGIQHLKKREFQNRTSLRR